MMADDTESTGGFDGPSHLQAAGRRFWREMTEAYEFAPHERAILAEACATLDRAEQFRRALRRHGLTQTNRYGAEVLRPEVAAERHARAAFASLVGKLGLPSEVEDVPMPPRSEWSRIVPPRRGVTVEQWEAAVREKVRRGLT